MFQELSEKSCGTCENLSGCTGDLARVASSAKQILVDINSKEEDKKAIETGAEAKKIITENKKAEAAQQKEKI